jgi:hypothetical protein
MGSEVEAQNRQLDRINLKVHQDILRKTLSSIPSSPLNTSLQIRTYPVKFQHVKQEVSHTCLLLDVSCGNDS